MIKERIGCALRRIGNHRRSQYISNLRNRNKNLTPTIISNNCIAGIIYHDLGLPFLSPTINLFFDPDDYIEFVNHLEHYLSCVPQEVAYPDVSYPVGTLTRDDKQIYLYFMHYKSFEEARNKWVERSKRVDFNNLYVVFEFNNPFIKSENYTPITDENNYYYKQFKRFPYSSKRMITQSTIKHDKEVINSDCYKNYYPGKLLEYPKIYSKKRYLNCLDYIEFLNKRQTKDI